MKTEEPHNMHIDIRKQRAGVDCLSMQDGDNPRYILSEATLGNVTFAHPGFKNTQFLKCLENYSPLVESIVAALGAKYLDALHESKSRKVFARLRFACFEPKLRPIPSTAERIYFNPKKGDTFFHFYRPGTPANTKFGGKTGQYKIDFCRIVFCDSHGITWGVI